MNVSIIRIIIIGLSVCLLIVIDPTQWTTGTFALLQKNIQMETNFIGVIDRFEKNKAIILIDNIKKELQIEKSQLPDNCKEGTWLLINKNSDDSYTIVVQSELTDNYNRQSKSLMRQLLGGSE